MFKRVDRFMTGDGLVYDSEKHARQHVETVICDAFMRALQRSKTATHADRIQIVELLYQHRGSIREALALETFGNDED